MHLAELAQPLCSTGCFSSQPIVFFFSHQTSTSHQPTIIFSHNKPALAISHSQQNRINVRKQPASRVAHCRSLGLAEVGGARGGGYRGRKGNPLLSISYCRPWLGNSGQEEIILPFPFFPGPNNYPEPAQPNFSWAQSHWAGSTPPEPSSMTSQPHRFKANHSACDWQLSHHRSAGRGPLERGGRWDGGKLSRGSAGNWAVPHD